MMNGNHDCINYCPYLVTYNVSISAEKDVFILEIITIQSYCKSHNVNGPLMLTKLTRS